MAVCGQNMLHLKIITTKCTAIHFYMFLPSLRVSQRDVWGKVRHKKIPGHGHNEHCIQQNGCKKYADKINEVRSRFSFTKYLSATLLLMSENFQNFSNLFPEKHLELIVEGSTVLHNFELKTELHVLYSRDDLWRVSGATALLVSH